MWSIECPARSERQPLPFRMSGKSLPDKHMPHHEAATSMASLKFEKKKSLLAISCCRMLLIMALFSILVNKK